MNADIELMRLRHENVRLQIARPCWDNGVRMCDTDRGPNSSCGRPATQVWIDPTGDDFFFCGDECREYVLFYQGGNALEIGVAHGFTVYAYTPEPEEGEEGE